MSETNTLQQMQERLTNLNKDVDELKQQIVDEQRRYLENGLFVFLKQTRLDTVFETLFVAQGTKAPIVLFRAKAMPDLAVLCYGSPDGYSTRWRFSLHSDEGYVSSYFYLVCACCCELDTFLTKPEDVEERVWIHKCLADFHSRLVEVCNKHGVKNIFVRQATRYKERIQQDSTEELRVSEGNELSGAVREAYGPAEWGKISQQMLLD